MILGRKYGYVCKGGIVVRLQLHSDLGGKDEKNDKSTGEGLMQLSRKSKSCIVDKIMVSIMEPLHL